LPEAEAKVEATVEAEDKLPGEERKLDTLNSYSHARISNVSKVFFTLVFVAFVSLAHAEIA
jgi:hypothetical protein